MDTCKWAHIAIYMYLNLITSLVSSSNNVFFIYTCCYFSLAPVGSFINNG